MNGPGRVRFGGFEILWLEPNPTCYQKIFCNPTHQALKTDPTRRVGLDRVGFCELAGWLHTPTFLYEDSTISTTQWPSPLQSHHYQPTREPKASEKHQLEVP